MNLSVIVLLVLCLLATSEAEKSCGPQYKGARLRISKGKKIWNRSWGWSDPDSKHVTVSECQTRCYKKKGCGGWEWTANRFGAGCSLYKPLPPTKEFSLDKNYKCDMCDAFAGVCP